MQDLANARVLESQMSTIKSTVSAAARACMAHLRLEISLMIDSGLVGSTDFHSSHPQGHEHSGRGTTRAEDAQGTPTQSHISPSILVYEDKLPYFPQIRHFLVSFRNHFYRSGEGGNDCLVLVSSNPDFENMYFRGRKGVFVRGRAVPPRSDRGPECSYFTETCSGSEAGSYLRLIDFCITRL